MGRNLLTDSETVSIESCFPWHFLSSHLHLPRGSLSPEPPVQATVGNWPGGCSGPQDLCV